MWNFSDIWLFFSLLGERDFQHLSSDLSDSLVKGQCSLLIESVVLVSVNHFWSVSFLTDHRMFLHLGTYRFLLDFRIQFLT